MNETATEIQTEKTELTVKKVAAMTREELKIRKSVIHTLMEVYDRTYREIKAAPSVTGAIQSHYCWIKNFCALIGSQMSKNAHKNWKNIKYHVKI